MGDNGVGDELSLESLDLDRFNGLVSSSSSSSSSSS